MHLGDCCMYGSFFFPNALALWNDMPHNPKETGSWKWTAAAFLIPAVMGFIFCFLVSRVAVSSIGGWWIKLYFEFR